MGIYVGDAPEAQQAPRRMRKVVTVYEGNATQIEVTRYEMDDDSPATGPTTRLSTTCRACGDTLPVGATFCIECGEKV